MATPAQARGVSVAIAPKYGQRARFVHQRGVLRAARRTDSTSSGRFGHGVRHTRRIEIAGNATADCAHGDCRREQRAWAPFHVRVTERIECRDRRLADGGIGVSQQREQGRKSRRIADACQRCGGRGRHRPIGRQQPRERRSGPTIAELAERRDGGQLDLLVAGVQTIDEHIDDPGAVADERLDDIGAAGLVAQELGQRPRHCGRLDPAKEKNYGPKLLDPIVTEGIEEILRAGCVE